MDFTLHLHEFEILVASSLPAIILWSLLILIRDSHHNCWQVPSSFFFLKYFNNVYTLSQYVYFVVRLAHEELDQVEVGHLMQGGGGVPARQRQLRV